MYYEKQERELRLKDVIFAVLHQWRKILVLALVCALALGGLKAVSVWKKSPQSADETAYQQELETYRQNKEYKEQEILWIEEQILRQQTYLQESVLMNLDPTDLYRASMDFYIADANELYAQRILEHYRAALNDTAFQAAAAQALGMEPKYLRELLTITTVESVVGEVKQQYVSVVIFGADLESVTQLMELVYQCLDDAGAKVSAGFGPYTLVKVHGLTGKCVDTKNVAAAQWAEKERLANYENGLAGSKKALEAMKAPAAPEGGGSALRSGVKFAILGGLLGGVLGVLWALASILFGDRLYSATDLQGRYNVKILGTVAGKKKRFFLDRLLDKLEGRITKDTQQNDALLAANVCCHTDALLLCGNGAEAARIGGRLETALTVVEAGDPLQDMKALEKLQNAKAVALVVVCGKDRYSHMAKIMELVKDLNKQLVGCIVVEH